MKKIVVVDIDGTIAKIGDRLKYLKQTPKDWAAFYASSFDDDPIQEMCDLVSLLCRKGDYRIVFLTGRRESVRAETRHWLSQNIFGSVISPSHKTLIMRQNDDLRHDTVVKIEQFKNAGYLVEDIAFVFEDRSSMVKAWRDLGVLCLQVG